MLKQKRIEERIRKDKIMKIEEFKKELSDYKENMSNKKGSFVTAGKSGPVSIGLVEKLLDIIESQDQRISDLERENHPRTM